MRSRRENSTRPVVVSSRTRSGAHGTNPERPRSAMPGRRKGTHCPRSNTWMPSKRDEPSRCSAHGRPSTPSRTVRFTPGVGKALKGIAVEQRHRVDGAVGDPEAAVAAGRDVFDPRLAQPVDRRVEPPVRQVHFRLRRGGRGRTARIARAAKSKAASGRAQVQRRLEAGAATRLPARIRAHADLSGTRLCRIPSAGNLSSWRPRPRAPGVTRRLPQVTRAMCCSRAFYPTVRSRYFRFRSLPGGADHFRVRYSSPSSASALPRTGARESYRLSTAAIGSTCWR